MTTPSTPARPAAPDRPIFVIASNNTAVHVYRDVKSMLDAKEVDASRLDSIEFFDVRGHRLAPVVSGTGMLKGLKDAGGRPNTRMVQTRLYAVRRHLAATVDVRLAEAVPPVTREEALSRLPELEGKSLPDCYVLLEPIFSHTSAGDGPIQPMHDGGWWHNLWAH